MTSAVERYRAAERALWDSFEVSPKEQFVDVGSGLRVRVQELGAGPPALFIHGVTTSGTSFAPLVARLAGLGCMVLDRPGCGLSDPWKLNDEFREQAVDAIQRTLDALRIESVVLVGNSLGALWSTWFSLAHPDRVRKLVLLGPSIGFPGVRAPAFMRVAAFPGLGGLLKRMMRPSPKSLRRIFASMGHQKSLDAGKIPEVFFDWGMRLAADTGTLGNDFDAILGAMGFGGVRSWIQIGEQALRTVSVPTLLLSGTDDSHGGPLLASRAGELIPNATVQVLRDAGHLPWLDDPSAVAEAIQRFAL